MKTFKKFNIDVSGLSKEEQQVLDKLIEASRLIAPLYEKQKNPELKGANFYSPEFSKKEIEKTAENNKNLLHPYTFVEKGRTGKPKPVYFQKKFVKELKKVAQKIEEAAKLSSDKGFSKYLKEMARSLLEKQYAKNEILWVTQKSATINFIIGPVERYLDGLFFKKAAYQAWVGVLNEEKTKEARRFREIILASRRKILPDTAKIKSPELRIDINRTLCFSGLIAEHMFTGTSLPNDMDLMQEHGSRLTIFESSLNLKFGQDHYPLFHKIFPKSVKEDFSEKELYEGSLRCILLHEISHSLIRYRDAEQRLRELFPVFDEILAYVIGIEACSSLMLKGALSQRELEAVLLMHLVRNFTWWEDFQNNPGVKDYTTGAAIATNFYLEEGAIEEKNGFCGVDFNKLFMSIGRLSRMLEYHLAAGSYEEAKEFVEKYGGFEVFKEFKSRFKNL